MELTKIKYLCVMEDGTEHTAVADGRDFAAVELQEYPELAHRSRGRYMAWHALHRTGAFKGEWETFNAACVDIDVLDTEAIGDPNRGRPDHDGGHSSTSPSGPGNH